LRALSSLFLQAHAQQPFFAGAHLAAFFAGARTAAFFAGA